MKILVTGATGFIGHHVVNWLAENRADDEKNSRVVQEIL